MNNVSTYLSLATDSLDAQVIVDRYNQYMESEQWKTLKNESDLLWGKSCFVCGATHFLEHHHLFYRQEISKGTRFEVLPVCQNCHEACHKNNQGKNGHPQTAKAYRRLIRNTFERIVLIRGFPLNRCSMVIRKYWDVYKKHHPDFEPKKTEDSYLTRKVKRKRARYQRQLQKRIIEHRRLSRELGAIF